jgi:hypothetical protein
MMKYGIALLSALLLLSCSRQQDAGTPDAAPPFAKVLLRNADAKEPELCFIANGLTGGAKELDAFVGKHAEAALREAERHNLEDPAIIFFFRNSPTSDVGSWGGFSIAKLKDVVIETKAGKTFLSEQAWPSHRFPDMGNAEPEN